jgi:23S rRNA (adenine2503-C2)-methyltransferase
MALVNVLALTLDELTREVARRYGKGAFHADAVYREVFRHGSLSLAGVEAFSKSGDLGSRVERDLHLPSCRVTGQHAEGGVIKFVSTLADGHTIESVIIPARGRTTLCVSSQVGCRWGCRFCATGRMGLVRNLGTDEIVWQVYAARFLLCHRVDNIVFMGMGEPLDNFENVVQAVRVLSDQHGFDIARRHMTLSTAGHADGIRKLAAANLPALRLAVSINAARNTLRSRLMPINQTYPLERLKDELRAFPLGRKGVVFVEYVLLAGINDTREDAAQLARFLEGLPVRVNVIPYNGPGAGDYVAPAEDQVRRFRAWLEEEKLFTRTRRSRGRGVMAACGQLGSPAV